MECRILTIEDAGLLKHFVDDQRTQYNEEQIAIFLQQEHAVGFVGVEEEKIIGFAIGYKMIKPDGRKAFYLHAIDVMEQYQRKGFGTVIMTYIRNRVKEMGCDKMFLITNKENEAACKCYEKAGGEGKPVVLYEFAEK